jgi:signal transduction histidine kinase
VPATASELPVRARRLEPAVEIPATPRRARLRPRWTLRLRLTLLYGSLFLVAGAVLLAITYGLVASSMERQSLLVRATPGKTSVVAIRGSQGAVYFSKTRPVKGPQLALPADVPQKFKVAAASIQQQAQAALERQRQNQLGALLTKSIFGLGIMAIVSIGLGWLVAGRALRPLRTMGVRARGISERNLHERLALTGPSDELKELGDTFDGLLARLESAFESQRRFVANASHELRTPITVERTLVEVALADPDASVRSLRATCERVLASSEQQERLIEALLTLARSQRGLERREALDVAEIARRVLCDVAPREGISLHADLDEAPTSGDAALLERLIANLVDNAHQYNRVPGWITISTGSVDGRALLTVENSGPEIAADEAPGLTEPFRRLNGDRTRHRAGLGLGLSIVEAIARAHDAELTAVPRAEGGLAVAVSFPRP